MKNKLMRILCASLASLMLVLCLASCKREMAETETQAVNGTQAAAEELCKRLSADTAQEVLALTFHENGETVKVGDTQLKTMSFNLLVGNEWETRAAAILSLIKKYSPDTLGVQEAAPYWIEYLSENLEGYKYVGVGRDGGSSGEYSAVFYKEDKFTLTDSGTKWLSDTPDIPTKYDESMYNRIMTYARLKRKSDGKEFIHVNTHLDHSSSLAREKQAMALLELLGDFGDIPLLISGDLNDERGSSSIGCIESGGFAVSSELAAAVDRTPTFKQKTIDFIMVKGSVKVYEYRVDASSVDGVDPSDHNPIYITYDI